MKNKEYVSDWLKRAKSNLEMARIGRVVEDILYEDLCFGCQQAAEKAIKALLIGLDKEYRPTHSIARLLEILLGAGIDVPEEVRRAVELTDYAVKTRYPGQEPVSEVEYNEALKLAETVFEWVTDKLEVE